LGNASAAAMGIANDYDFDGVNNYKLEIQD